MDGEDVTPFDEDSLAHMRGLRRILRFLATDDRIGHMRDRMVVFGSAAAGKACPGDIDVLVDFGDFEGGVLAPYQIPGAGLLLAVAGQFYGSFDPFVKVGPHLYCRNDAASGWEGARRARTLLKEAREHGRPPAEVLAEIRSRPYVRGGAPDPVEPASDAASGPKGP